MNLVNINNLFIFFHFEKYIIMNKHDDTLFFYFIYTLMGTIWNSIILIFI